MLDADREMVEQAVRKVLDADYDRIMRRIQQVEERVAELERHMSVAQTNIKKNKDRSVV